jgi:hypothetical protein
LHIPLAHQLQDAPKFGQLALLPEKCVGKGNARICAKLPYLLACLEHRSLAHFEQFVKLVYDPFAQPNKVLEDPSDVIDQPDPSNALFAPFDPSRDLDQKEQHLASQLPG